MRRVASLVARDGKLRSWGLGRAVANSASRSLLAVSKTEGRLVRVAMRVWRS